MVLTVLLQLNLQIVLEVDFLELLAHRDANVHLSVLLFVLMVLWELVHVVVMLSLVELFVIAVSLEEMDQTVIFVQLVSLD